MGVDLPGTCLPYRPLMLLQQSAPASAGVFHSEDSMAYQEFPAWATGPDGAQRLVNSRGELDALPGFAVPEYVAPVPHEESPTFVAYPKWIGDALVQSAEEEAALLGADTADEREILIQIASEKGVKIDKRWSDEKIRAALEGA
jgi:hypothetical protein